MFFTLSTLLNEPASKDQAKDQNERKKKKTVNVQATLDKRSVQIYKAKETLTVVLVGTSNTAAEQELLTRGKLVFRASKGRQDNGRVQTQKVEGKTLGGYMDLIIKWYRTLPVIGGGSNEQKKWVCDSGQCTLANRSIESLQRNISQGRSQMLVPLKVGPSIHPFILPSIHPSIFSTSGSWGSAGTGRTRQKVNEAPGLISISSLVHSS